MSKVSWFSVDHVYKYSHLQATVF